jgi:hypothetical protein
MSRKLLTKNTPITATLGFMVVTALDLYTITLKKTVYMTLKVGFRRLHNEEIHNLYASLNIVRVIKSRRIRRTGHVARMGETRNIYSSLVGKPEGMRPLGRRSRRREDNIRMDQREVRW